MKLSTRKILALEVATLILYVVATFGISSAVWRGYGQIVVLVAAIIGSVILLGWAKPRNHGAREVALVVMMLAVLFQVVSFVLLGMKQGFLANVYVWNWTSWTKVFLPAVLIIIAEEVLRNQLLEKGKSSRLVVVMTTGLIWLMEILLVGINYNLGESREVFDLVMVVSFPALIKNIMLSYLTLGYDYRISIGFRLVMELPVLLLPIWPDVSQYLTVIFQMALVVVVLIVLVMFHRGKVMGLSNKIGKSKSKKVTTDFERKTWKIARYVVWSAIVIMMVGYVGLMSGIFKYYFLAVGSGSMEPVLSRGDMILVKRLADYRDVNEGEVLVFQHSGVIVVHRVINKTMVGEKYVFETKGDANGEMDSWLIAQDDVVGVARGKIAAFGYPTLWFNELFNGEKI